MQYFTLPGSLPVFLIVLQALLISASPEAPSSCQDTGCSDLFSGRGVCVNLRTVNQTNFESLSDTSTARGCSCSGEDGFCLCFKQRHPETRGACKVSKACTKKGGKCYKKNSAPEGAQDLGLCGKKAKCRCYKEVTESTTPGTSSTTTPTTAGEMGHRGSSG